MGTMGTMFCLPDAFLFYLDVLFPNILIVLIYLAS
jgi:hypothetical protein